MNDLESFELKVSQRMAPSAARNVGSAVHAWGTMGKCISLALSACTTDCTRTLERNLRSVTRKMCLMSTSIHQAVLAILSTTFSLKVQGHQKQEPSPYQAKHDQDDDAAQHEFKHAPPPTCSWQSTIAQKPDIDLKKVAVPLRRHELNWERPASDRETEASTPLRRVPRLRSTRPPEPSASHGTPRWETRRYHTVSRIPGRCHAARS